MLEPGKHQVVWRSASLSFFLDQRNGKNCFLLGPAKLKLSHGYELERCWEMKPHPKSRFLEVAVLLNPSLFDIQVSINAKMLSPETVYAAYLVFGFEGNYTRQLTANSIITLSNNSECVVNDYFSMVQFEAGDSVRADDWMEIELGEFYVGVEDNKEVQVQLQDMSKFELGGIIVEGIEFRPLRRKSSFKSPTGKILSQLFPSSFFRAVFNLGTSSHNYSKGLSRFSPVLSNDACSEGEILPTANWRIYTHSDLRNATRNFMSDLVLGVGGFGTVYKGWIDEKTLMPSKLGTGMMVAIKRLDPWNVKCFQEWQSEVNFLGRLLHPNLLMLFGYGWVDKELLLVYEFMKKGSLENHLFKRNAAIEPLSWDLRLKICKGAARGLAFLHTSDNPVMHRDFNSSNILLDGNYDAKISYFSVATLGPSGDNSHVTTRGMETYVYAAPEYIETGRMFVKSNVYSFGVVLLEMLTGLRALDMRRPNGQQQLVDWKKPELSQRRKIKSLMDPRIQGQYSSKAAKHAAVLTDRCLETDTTERPSMKEVVDVLEQIVAMEKMRD